MTKRNTQESLRIFDERLLLKTRICDVVSARVENLRTGRDGEFVRFDFPHWVNIVAITKDEEIVIIRQHRFGSEQVEIEIPGGAVEEGEPPLEAGRRELLEETGFAGKNGRIIGKVCPNPAIQKNWCYTVLFEEAEKVADQNMDDMEDIEVDLLPLKEMYQLIDEGRITHGLVLNAIMFYDRLS